MVAEEHVSQGVTGLRDPAEPLQDQEREPVVVTVDRAGNLYIDIGSGKNQPVDADTLQQRVGAVLRQQPKTQILVRGDRGVDYGLVVEAMVLLQSAGVEKVGLMTESPDQ